MQDSNLQNNASKAFVYSIPPIGYLQKRYGCDYKAYVYPPTATMLAHFNSTRECIVLFDKYTPYFLLNNCKA